MYQQWCQSHTFQNGFGIAARLHEIIGAQLMEGGDNGSVLIRQRIFHPLVIENGFSKDQLPIVHSPAAVEQ